MFFELDMSDFKKILPLYQKEEIIFPLILAVVQKKQRGWVFVDHPDNPASAIVVNNFGFMQFVGNQNFDDELNQFFKTLKTTLPSYLLWYAPPLPIQKVLDNFPQNQVRRRERVRFVFKKRTFEYSAQYPAGFSVQHLDKKLITDTRKFKLDIDSRFWASTEDFLNHGIGICITKAGEIVSLCYSACVVDNLAEIDVVTQTEYRGMGLAVIATQNFISECLQRGIMPTWDCFTNNTASMKLAIKLGFTEETIYPFYSFNVPFTLSVNGREDDHS